MKKRDAKKQSENAVDRMARRTANATVWLAIVTIALAVASGLTLLVLKEQLNEMKSGGVDTAKLAGAAAKQADAATDMATAAGDQVDAANNFSDSAEEINQGVAGAVDQLNLQANKLEESAAQMRRLAGATEKANANVINSDRPWMGIGITVDGFEEGKNPIATIQFMNSGRRPARITLTEYAATPYKVFPANPRYVASRVLSANLLVPNSTTGIRLKIPPIYVTKPFMVSYAVGEVTLFIYANVEYEDITTRIKHWTHACYLYNPKTESTDAGFYNCGPEYNATDNN